MSDEKFALEFPIIAGICSFCFPNHSNKLMEEAGFHTKNGNWKGGYTKEKDLKYKNFRKEFEKDRLKNVVPINLDYGVYLCKDHLLKLVQQLEKTEQQQLVDKAFSGDLMLARPLELI